MIRYLCDICEKDITEEERHIWLWGEEEFDRQKYPPSILLCDPCSSLVQEEFKQLKERVKHGRR